MSMKDVINLVNEGKVKYKFCRMGSVFVGLIEESFTENELNGKPFGYLKMNGKLFFRKLK